MNRMCPEGLAILVAIHHMGGCDATDDYGKGWDEATKECEDVVMGITGYTYRDIEAMEYRRNKMISAKEAREKTRAVNDRMYELMMAEVEEAISSAIEDGETSCLIPRRAPFGGLVKEELKRNGYCISCEFDNVDREYRYLISWAEWSEEGYTT